jgi:hypothetical protein
VGDGAFVAAAGTTLYYSTQNFGNFRFVAPLVHPVAAGAGTFDVPVGTPFQVGDFVSPRQEPVNYQITGLNVVDGNLQVTVNGAFVHEYLAAHL